MSENQRLGGEPDRRVILRLTPQQAVVLTVHDHQILPSYGVLNDITEGGRASFNDHLLEAGRSVRLRLGFNETSEPFETEARIVWSQNDLPIGALHGARVHRAFESTSRGAQSTPQTKRER